MHASPFVRALLLVLACSPALRAATVVVNTTSDIAAVDGTCSLREAITAVNRQGASGNVNGECAAGDGNDDTIMVPAGVYTLSLAGIDEDNNASGDLDVRASVILQGAGRSATIIDANGIDRVLDIPVGSVTAGIKDLELVNGHAPDGVSGPGETGGAINNPNGASVILWRVDLSANASGSGTRGAEGGAIFSNGGTVRLIDCSLVNNHSGSGGVVGATGGDGGNGGAIATHGTTLVMARALVASSRSGDGVMVALPAFPGFGGALFAAGGSVTILGSAFDSNTTTSQSSGGQGAGGAIYVANAATRIVQSSITRNAAAYGAGIWSADGPLSLTNATLSGNRAGITGGGAYVAGGDVQVEFSTISANQAVLDHGGGFRFEFGNASAAMVTFRNSIVAGNLSNSAADCYQFSPGSATLTSLGYNVVGSFCPAGPNDVTTSQPRLGPLADNGGLGLTHMPLPGGPAVDRGNCLAAAISLDGRDHERFVDVPRVLNSADACDIGATELDDDIFWSGFDS